MSDLKVLFLGGSGIISSACSALAVERGVDLTVLNRGQTSTRPLPEAAPRWEQPDGTVKSSAAWLIEHAGFGKGYVSGDAGERVALSTKHTLALTNRGGATTAELLALAREVRDGVRERFGVTLVNEPVTVGCSL